MIFYTSTRGDKKFYKFSAVILKGIAPDGGLFIPAEIPHLSADMLKELTGKSYQEICLEIFNLFQTDFSSSLLKKIIDKAYSFNFDNPQIAPLFHLKNNQYILELWHGPTSSFKDIALQIMPLFFSEAIKINNKKRKKKDNKLLNYLILVATSGDTGKAALEGFKDKKNISIIVIYPDGKISKLQELSMTTQEGNNVEVIGMDGDFDDTQRCVKEVFNDWEFNEKLFNDYNTVLSSANSINWGRLLPQIVYHVKSYLGLVNQGVIEIGEKIDIAVPTGNFGNILSAFYAREMGLPIRRLICASNTNNVLTEFLKTGVYDIGNRKLIKTPSPSMDIIISSNIERLLYELTKNPEMVSLWMNRLKENKKFIADIETKKVLPATFYADWVSNDDCLKTIEKLYNETKYLIDPHTAVAKTVADRYQNKYRSNFPILICSTAHWAKFPKDVNRALNKLETGDEFTLMKVIKAMDSKIPIPQNIMDLENKKIRFKDKCEARRKKVENHITQYLTK